MKKYLLLFVVALFFSTQTIAAVDFSTTINLAGKQRMLTQKMAKEAVLVALDVDKAANLRNLKATRNLFDRTLKGLKNGDAELGLHPVKAPKIQSQLDTVSALWGAYDIVISSIIHSGHAAGMQIDLVASLNMPVLQEMNRAVHLYEDEASAGHLSPELAAAINIAGRQRMLTQKMSKAFFLIADNHQVDANKASLSKTVELFERSLNGLMQGDQVLQLPKPPTDEIAAQLKTVQSMWAEFKSIIQSEPTPANVQHVAEKNPSLLQEMNKAVNLYEASS